MATTKAATLSIQKQPGYTALRLCAQTCVDRGSDNSDLEGHLECGDKQILNACFCRADLRPKATAFLSSCIITRCKYNSQDVTSALKLYDGYCSFKPKTTSASATKTSTTRTTSTASQSSSSTATPAPSITALSATDLVGVSEPSTLFSSTESPTTTPESATSPSTAQPMAGSTIAGIVIGGIAAVFLAMAILMWFCRRGQKEEVGDPSFGRVQQSKTGGGAHKAGFGHGYGQYHDPDAAYETGGGMYKGSAVALDESRGVESFDMGAMAARPMDFTMTNTAYPYAMGPAPVEICDTGFRAELDAGRDGVGTGSGIYKGEKG